MKFDVVFLSYNSEKWIKDCNKAIAELEYNLKDLNIIYVDNLSKDNSYELLLKEKEKYKDAFGSFKVIKSDKNLGFGLGNNLGSESGSSKHIAFLNIDTKIHKTAFTELEKEIKSSDEKFAMWEFRQFPYEHPKYYDPVTLETSWSSGAAFVITRELFERIGGFSKDIFMYAEDVDLSFRVRTEGYKIKYVPKAVIDHYCYSKVNEVKPLQYINSVCNNLLMRAKFGNIKKIIKGHFMFLKVFMKPEPIPYIRRKLLKQYFKNVGPTIRAIFWRWGRSKQVKDLKVKFWGFDYELTRSRWLLL